MLVEVINVKNKIMYLANDNTFSYFSLANFKIRISVDRVGTLWLEKRVTFLSRRPSYCGVLRFN